VTNTPTGAANTAIGQKITMADTTALANTVQGFVVDTTGVTNSSALVTGALVKVGSGQTALQLQGTSASLLQVQTSGGGNTLLTADTSNMIVKVGTTAAPTLAGAQLLVTSAEATTTVRIGNATNGVDINGTSPIAYRGSARPTKQITLTPEFPGATMTPDGTSNSGQMTSDFCSGSSRLNINTAVCTNATESHNYYTWTTTQVTSQNYDIYVRWQVPSDFSGWTSDTALSGYGWKTASGDAVTLSMYNSSGTQCGSSTDLTNATTGAWASSTQSGLNACGVTAGSIVIFKIHLVAAASGDFARVGELSLSYLAGF
jgi:hypothetical protein